ncbi:MAG: metallophosphoesterase [Candidatus Omnitrophica bacterium]|nr:metallophosphoesterase [Candidatus Omnitrophota bacterium]
MRIGIIADTHDNMEKIECAMNWLADRGVEHIIHAGDYVAPFSLKLIFKMLGAAQFTGVFGNNDGEKKGLESVARGTLHKAPYSFSVGDIRFYLTHDLVRTDIPKLCSTHDVIIHGHTHKAEITRQGTTLIINPGACCGILAEYPSIAMLYVPEMKAEIIRLDELR